ncbi:MAG: fibronectin type III domain-containing protein [Elainellaceae cyanobacterium]
MDRYSNGRVLMMAIAILVVTAYLLMALHGVVRHFFTPSSSSSLLTDPFLQNPTADSVRVVWFTEFEGTQHQVRYGDRLNQSVAATTRKLSRMREDSQSRVGEQTEDGQIYSQPVEREIWRHEAEVRNLVADTRVPYQVLSVEANGRVARSEQFDLAPLPSAGKPLKILLTSDHQLMPMTPANLQKIVETVGSVDAVFLAGDLVNIPDRASEWFDDNRGRAFFPAMQGRAQAVIENENEDSETEENTSAQSQPVYQGGALIQSAPLFTALGNHEVMGRFSMEKGLNDQFNDPVPRAIAQQRYATQAATLNPGNDQNVQDIWVENHSFNSDSYEEIFSLPKNPSGNSRYYAVTFGDIRLVSLYVTQIWRVPSLDPWAKGRYRERDEDLNQPENWGFGQHIFESVTPGSAQYQWLQTELNSPEFTQANYRIVMLHHPPHSLGDNIVPAFTNPVQFIDTFSDGSINDGSIKAVRYEYPQNTDALIRDVMPMLEAADTHLVLYGHSHLWNRFTSPTGTHYLETSNVGNSYGAYLDDRRAIPIGYQEDYTATGDPNGLEPVMPSLAPIVDQEGRSLPYLASNDITAFSILDTETGVISSYRFDTRTPDKPVVKFDEFSIYNGHSIAQISGVN